MVPREPGPKDPPRILVIDDNASVRQLLRRRLEAPPLKAEITEADDGSSGLRIALEQEFDCVLCDLNMVRVGGIAFLRMVRAQRSRMELPVVLVTAEDAVADKVGGFRCGASDFVTKPFEPAELIARVETQVALARMHRQVSRMADLDALTQAWNRRKFTEGLRAEFSRARRTNRLLSLAVLDVDHFKKINDTHGHPVGDAVLVDLARVIGQERRIYDGVGRLGGEEFAVLLPETGVTGGSVVGERLRAAIAAASLGGLPIGAVTVSIGVAQGPVDAEDTPEALYKRADERLYEAKRGGRDRVVAGVNGRRASAAGRRSSSSTAPVVAGDRRA